MTLSSSTIRVGSRRSALALRQTEMVREALARCGAESSLVTFSTVGDERLDVPLPAIGGKGVFTAELEAALHAGHVDLCVHSLKDLPTVSPDGLVVGAVLPRETPLDALLLPASAQAPAPAHTVLDALAVLPPGATVGTSSLRRAAMLRTMRPDLEVRDLRGNVPTRIAKLDAGEYHAIVLAGAGLVRLGLGARVSQWLPAAEWLPAPGQGVVAIQARAAEAAIHDVLTQIHDRDAWDAAAAERAFLHALDGGCQVPVAALARVEGGTLHLEGCILDVGGGTPIAGKIDVSRHDALEGGATLARTLLARGADRLLARARGTAAS